MISDRNEKYRKLSVTCITIIANKYVNKIYIMIPKHLYQEY